MGRSPSHRHPQGCRVRAHLSRLQKQPILQDALVRWGLRARPSRLSVHERGWHPEWRGREQAEHQPCCLSCYPSSEATGAASRTQFRGIRLHGQAKAAQLFQQGHLWPCAVMVSQRKKHLLSPNCPKHHIFHPKGKAERCGFPRVLHFSAEEQGLAGSLLAQRREKRKEAQEPDTESHKA